MTVMLYTAARLAVFPEPFEHLAVYEYNEGLVSHSVYQMFGDHEGTTELQRKEFSITLKCHSGLSTPCKDGLSFIKKSVVKILGGILTDIVSF